MIKPLVSIIVPAYNHGKYVRYCLDSIIGQTYENIELIILNDGSKDNTNLEIMKYEKKLKERFANYTYINKQNEGICKTINKGLDISKGKYLIFFASDDVMYPERVEKQVSFLENNDRYGMVYTDGYNVVSEEDMFIDKEYNNHDKFSNIMEFKQGDLYEFMLENVFLMPTPTVCIRKECFDLIGNYDEELLCEDPDMFLRISKDFEIGCIKEILALHRIHGNNSGKNLDIIVPTMERMIEKYETWTFRNEQDKDVLMRTLRRAGIMEDYYKILEDAKGKKLIGWGSGKFYRTRKEKYDFNLSYIIDSNKDKQETTLDGILIKAPRELLKEDKDKVFIIVFSQFYKEIYACLDEYGFEYLSNYY